MLRARLKLQVALVTATCFVINTSYRMFYPFLAVFARGLGVDLRTISLTVSALDAAGMIGPFLASTGDTRGRKAAILLGASAFSAGLLLAALFPAYPFFLIAVVLMGAGVSATVPAVHAFLGDEFPYNRRGLAISIVEMNWSAAYILGVPLVGLLIARYGWSAPFPVLAGVALAMLGLLVWILPAGRAAPAASRPLANIRRVLAYAPALAGLFLAISVAMGNELISLVFGIWMQDRFGLQVAALGAASMVIGFAELSGESLAAGLMDRAGKRRSIALGLGANALAAALLLLLGRSLVGALVGLFLFYLSFEYTVLAVISLMTEVYPAARGTLVALVSAAFLIGRSAGAASGGMIYQGWGIAANALAAGALDLAALLLLRRVTVRHPAPAAEPLPDSPQ